MSIYVDLDGTLAEYHSWKGVEHIGAPIPAMINRVKAWLEKGETVKIFTARVSDTPEAKPHIQKWLNEQGLGSLEITCIKGFDGNEFWDDRAVTVEKNTGRIRTHL